MTNTKSRLLYKFLPEKNFKQHWQSLLEGEVYFSSWKDFNDPMEGFFSYIANHSGQKSQAVNVTGTKNLFTVTCFSSSSGSMLMWSHYANNHKGVCLEFEIDESVLQAHNILSADVKYSKKLPVLSSSAIDKQNAHTFLSSKLHFWEYEKEVRLLAKNSNAGVYGIGNMTKIIAGMRFQFDLATEYQLRVDITSAVKSKNVKIHRADYDVNTFDIIDNSTVNF